MLVLSKHDQHSGVVFRQGALMLYRKANSCGDVTSHSFRDTGEPRLKSIKPGVFVKRPEAYCAAPKRMQGAAQAGSPNESEYWEPPRMKSQPFRPLGPRNGSAVLWVGKCSQFGFTLRWRHSHGRLALAQRRTCRSVVRLLVLESYEGRLFKWSCARATGVLLFGVLYGHLLRAHRVLRGILVHNFKPLVI